MYQESERIHLWARLSLLAYLNHVAGVFLWGHAWSPVTS